MQPKKLRTDANTLYITDYIVTWLKKATLSILKVTLLKSRFMSINNNSSSLTSKSNSIIDESRGAEGRKTREMDGKSHRERETVTERENEWMNGMSK